MSLNTYARLLRPIAVVAFAGAMFGLSNAASALSFVSVSSNSANDFADTSLPGALFLESAHSTTTPVRFVFSVDAGDSVLSFDAITRWVGGGTMPGVRVSLDSGAVFSGAPGSIEPINNTGVTGLFGTPTQAGADFVGGTTDSYFGNPLGLAATTWTIDVSGVTGSTLGITVSPVPEPVSALLAALGLGVVASRARSRKAA
jgi:hypothetical protein